MLFTDADADQAAASIDGKITNFHIHDHCQPSTGD